MAARLAHRAWQLTNAQYSARIRAWLAELDVMPGWTFVAPSAASFIGQLWAGGTLVARADNSVLDGIRSTATALGSGLLRIHSSSAALLDELPSYAWDATASGRGEDKPLKRDDRSCDALRYAFPSTAHEWRALLAEAQ